MRSAMQTPFYRKPQFWLGMALSAVCLAAVLLLIDPAEIAAALRTADYRRLLPALGWLLAYMLLRAVRWRYLLGNQLSLGRVFHIQNIGYMLTQVLPLRLGDPVRGVLAGSTPPLTVAQGLSTMVVERILDMLAIVALLPLTLGRIPALPDWLRQGALVSGLVAATAVGGMVLVVVKRAAVLRLADRLLARIPRLNGPTWLRRLDELLHGLDAFGRWRSALVLTALSAVLWVPIILAYQNTMAAVGLTADWTAVAFVVCVAALSIAAPSSPGQVGVFHAGVTAAVALLGLDAAAGASFAFLYHAVNFLFIIALGLIGLVGAQAALSHVLAATRQLFSRRPAATDA